MALQIRESVSADDWDKWDDELSGNEVKQCETAVCLCQYYTILHNGTFLHILGGKFAFVPGFFNPIRASTPLPKLLQASSDERDNLSSRRYR